MIAIFHRAIVFHTTRFVSFRLRGRTCPKDEMSECEGIGVQ